MSHRRSWARALRIVVVSVAGTSGACAVGPDFLHPAPPIVRNYTPETEAGTNAGVASSARLSNAGEVPAAWWRVFGSEGIDHTVAEAISNNPTLASAQAALRQSEAARRAGYGVFMPQIGVGVGASRLRSAPVEQGLASPGSVFTLFTLSGTVGYVLDLFGAERRRVEALGAEVDYSRESVRAAYLALTGNVVATFVARSAYQAEVVATQELVDAASLQLQLTRSRYDAGTVAFASVAALESQVESLKATIPPLVQREEQATHLLSILAGHAPAEWQPPAVALEDITTPGNLPSVLPSELVRQRPDVRAADADLHIASANIGVTTANFFPAISVSGELGSATNRWASLPSPQGKFWESGVDLSQPVFQGGTLWFTRRAAIAAYQSSLENYRAVVLQGLDQVADALRALQHDSEAVAATAAADASAREFLVLTQANYDAGTADYLAVLVAMQSRKSAQLAYIQTTAQRLQDTVALFVALGGDWAVEPRQTVEGHA